MASNALPSTVPPLHARGPHPSPLFTRSRVAILFTVVTFCVLFDFFSVLTGRYAHSGPLQEGETVVSAHDYVEDVGGTPWTSLAPSRVSPSYPQWRFVTDRHGPARVSRPAAMASPLHCAGAMAAEALGLPPNDTRSCEWHTVEVRPLPQRARKGSAFADAFADERAAWAAAHVGLNVSDPSSVDRCVACLALSGNSTDGPACPLATSQLAALKVLLASSYIPPSVYPNEGGKKMLSAEGLVAAVTNVYVATPTYSDADLQLRMRAFELYETAVGPEAVALEGIVAAAGGLAKPHRPKSLLDHLRAAPTPFAARPLRAPSSPEALASLPPSSPLLLTLLGDDAHTFYGDGLPTALWLGNNTNVPARTAPLSNVLSSREAGAMASYSTAHGSALERIASVRAAASMSGHYRRVAEGLEELHALRSAPLSVEGRARRDALEASLRLPFAPPHPPTYLTAQAAVALTDRLVRLGPSGNAHYSDVLAEGMRSAVRSAAGIAHADPLGAAKSLPLPGLLSEAPPEVRASPEDALGGSWNMSDLPPWLRIPSFVNPVECLHPAAAAAASGLFQPPATGDDHEYEEPRSVLVIGPSHQRDLALHMCRQLLGAARRVNASRGVNALSRCRRMQPFVAILRREVYGDDDSSYPYPIPLAYSWLTMAPYRAMEDTVKRLLTSLGRTATPPRSDPLNVSAATTHSDGVVAGMARAFPHFTHEAMAGGESHLNTSNERNNDEPASDEAFTYSSLFLRSRRGDFDSLKGMFTHVIFGGGVWEAFFKDLSMPERTESAAMAIDLIREVFAPKKIIVYNNHHVWGPGFREEERAYKGAPLAPFSGARLECTNAGSLTKYRDAHLCAAYGPARARVRRAWAAELRITRDRAESAAVAAGHRPRSASPRPHNLSPPSANRKSIRIADDDYYSAEVFDALLPSSVGFAAVLSDEPGHHYYSIVADAIAQRILRDHVCPPRFVMAVRTDDTAEARGPPVNYANSGLPWRFPFPAGVDRVAIRVRTKDGSAARMPSLRLHSPPSVAGAEPPDMFEVRDLFPLFKTPLSVVSEGVCRAIFDHPYGDVNSHHRAVRRDPSFGLRGAPSAGDRSGEGSWWRSVLPSAPATAPAPPPFIHPSKLNPNLFPLHAPPRPYFMAVVRNNPFLPCITCSGLHSDALVAKADASRIDGMRAAFVRAAAARGGFVSPGDALYKSASLAVYSAPRYNVDSLYFLRTLGDYGVSPNVSCTVGPRGESPAANARTGNARRLPFDVAAINRTQRESCMPVPLVDLRARIVVSAYLRARR